MRKLALVLLYFLVIATIDAQECICEPIEVVNICYIPRSDYCTNEGSDNCGLTLDHPRAQAPALQQKISNPSNFGPNGVVSCTMNLVPMFNLNSIEQIRAENCHIFYVGNFPGPNSDGSFNSNFSAISDGILIHIYNWSLECSQNLAIVKQNESNPWGYNVQNQNQNPNRPLSLGSSAFSIFDGPFGQVNSFLQGGGFQGVFTQTADTGFDILALDANQRPTILLDHVSNDLLLGDVGILSSNGFGSVTDGPNVQNANDILACNIFALGCSLATESIVQFENVEICEGDSYTLPGGEMVLQDGAYVDTFKTATNCDSIIRTTISYFPDQNVIETYVGCEGDNYSIVVNNILYDESNPTGMEIGLDENGCEALVEINLIFNSPTIFEIVESICPNDGFQITVDGSIYDETNLIGTEIIQNSLGCDSTVNINLTLLEESFFEIVETPCISENFSLSINGNLYDESNPSGLEILENSIGCDSIVSIDFTYVEADTFIVSYSVCSDEPFIVDGQEYFAGQGDIITYSRINNCDSVLVFDIQNSDSFDQYLYDSILVVQQGRSERIKHLVPDNFSFEWAPSEGLSCDDCPNPTIFGEQIIEQYQYIITDELGCQITNNLEIKYITEPYIPNVFTPNGIDERNQVFSFFIGDHLSFTNEISVKSFKIYDRWGQLVHNISNVSLDDPILPWDGNIKNSKASVGVYIYQITLDYYDFKETVYQGTVTLVD